ncbi:MULTISPECIES: demethylmenaquinone methyltransferase [Thermoactinomyces]|jgi:demethylmenaquinone methyltransferase / 2-methoxy-6-polyprenyl-1,4-benzoquinol methylase|uniref:Demethylmenaquinone methyltransferase n=1 Tax=Thermoactinomyces daqus TaxID=1329516 RepID=A0A7W1XAK3_9BACL|nr:MULTISPECIES: demethylmenaquinone methyltransferase [Thermoactinomyces]MBA4543137.1 demethylmenaquinone methyltransferase [Thermoactinomyces daqus]MBH8596628.1 demethylmenaquinone methyltransferase [Thermoactinomyces sp. CICC 10523]MBH8603390.1 demethylmenaquinone methyltransferase [Thermoactinomyces sp. CICC 10522]MBH8607843.1 demethylmenaquinone methyltransferase [Thermoactinomyces sp. CICC 10521]
MNVRGEEKTKFVHEVFESIAKNYDWMNTLLSFRMHKLWRRFAMKKMAVKPGDTALDVCCGTCDWTISLAKSSGTGRIVGLDFSANMLKVGKGKVEKAGLDGQVELIQGDAMQLPFPDHTFDHATIGFALRNVPDIVQVLNEMKRVVKPGGQVVSLELSKPSWPPFRAVYYLYFERILPLLGKWFAGSYEQYRWLPESLMQFPGYHELARIMAEDVGLQDVQVYPLSGGIAALHIGRKPEVE